MPAPIAKGIILSISILLAAGFAVYESPQVRQWVDETRQKIAIALHSLGDEINPPRSPRPGSADASTREDDSPEAAERRRRAREEILERGRMMEERRRARSSHPSRGMSFDDMVDRDGKLKKESVEGANTTAAETTMGNEGLRKRTAVVSEDALGAAMGEMLANPFADEKHIDIQMQDVSASVESPQQSRESTATLPGSSPAVEPASYQQQQQQSLVDTETVSNHPSELLVDLTPTTSNSSARNDLSELTAETPQHMNYFSVNEWAENSTASFYSPPQSEVAYSAGGETTAAASDAGTGEHVENLSDVDMISDVGDTYTPSSWTEVGSVVSEED
ncbi:hypothetical protein MMC26_007334 [Xylographa opegraphella]|nr:hypothetical protein [Xylographa opegraphella]